ncbi:glycosyltransferase family 2 protein [Acinetobacter nosocomialis]|uniref:glycosyltransferase family 2 protein n=1 Tax=Acinetobacter calcoaceticus/baumannii complex TaxID=909768 RepID=UPI000B3E1D43|nr:glycosyltransferase family 2 protein [Acinetobacter nosocomialis]MDC4318533.1 glycosyltransferase [Acinetobacter baumannii]MDQ9041437.1 glycosyltransferase family 2 protein [Acinetobacter nosocomialis]OUT28017.1 glycosyltransferase [Acinetobacter nosocomialis P020]PSE18150.1 glycosyltransferase family 2 protein [Acinetobacter nosocomialis]QBF79885.1 glycosyltransferase family 2 protein [Acinetobacter nosocomialis]
MISVIVPVFNGEQFLERNFNSLSRQKGVDFEVIYINDGSIDNTKNLLEKLIQNDLRFKVFSTNNQGVMAARSVGVNLARFEFVTFLDVDDVLDEHYLSIFFNEIQKEKISIYCTNFILSKPQKNIKSNKLPIGKFSNKEFIEILCVNGGWELCGKVYKKDLFQEVSYPSRIAIGEDALVLFQIAFFAQKVKVISGHLYTYISHRQSASSIRDIEKCRDGICAGIYIRNFLAAKKILEEKYLNALLLLFFSNSLKRGILTNNDELFLEVKKSVQWPALNLMPIKKRIVVIIGVLLTGLKFK